MSSYLTFFDLHFTIFSNTLTAGFFLYIYILSTLLFWILLNLCSQCISYNTVLDLTLLANPIIFSSNKLRPLIFTDTVGKFVHTHKYMKLYICFHYVVCFIWFSSKSLFFSLCLILVGRSRGVFGNVYFFVPMLTFMLILLYNTFFFAIVDWFSAMRNIEITLLVTFWLPLSQHLIWNNIL